MEVILRQAVDKLGHPGDIVKVSAGYARNFLLPKRMAVVATDSNKKIVEQEKQSHLRKEAKAAGEAQDLSKLLTALTLTVSRKAGEGDHLFGSVTANDVADLLAAQNFTIDRRKIQLEDPIRTLGEHKIAVKLHREVTTEITVNVTRED